jgi:hypothetical protein
MRAVIAAIDQRAEHLAGSFLGGLGEGIAAPGIAHQPLRAAPVAAREQGAGQHELPFGRFRRCVAEERQDGGVVTLVVP